MSQAEPSTLDKPPKINRRWYQYSLRTLLFVVTVCPVLSVWSDSARKQRDAVAALRQVGADARYDFDSHYSRPAFWPAWLTDALGADYFASVILIDLNHRQVSDADLEHLECLTALRLLDLRNTQISDSGIEHLKGLSRLRFLLLQDTKATDTGTVRLRAWLPKCDIAH